MSERSIFLAALDIGDPVQRAAFLDEECAGDANLRRHIDELIASEPKVGSFLDAPHCAVELTADRSSIAERPGTQIGPYKLLQQIGEGGMGVVFMAEQTQSVHRRVALKVVKAGMDTRQVVARFEAERQALAMMDHLHIAKVFDAGTTEAGRPYFVMELVHGIPITKYCNDNHLSPRQRLELFIPVCQAIQHAHQKGIIHRDIKPSNVLVCLYDGKPVPKVIDFGVAKAIEQRLTERTLFTQFGNIIGTFEYMSPEQAEMSQLGTDTRSDIYSLGVLLYELLTGTTPLDRERLRSAAFDELLRMIREEEPPKPSTRISHSASLHGAAAGRSTESAKLARVVRGDLDWIVMKCLEKDRTRRYETANGLARDIVRYLSDEPVEACPPSAIYRFGKFARRNKAGLAITTLIVLFVVLLGSVLGWTVRDRAAQRAEYEKQIANDRKARLAKTAEDIQLVLQEAQTLGEGALKLVNDNPRQCEATLLAALSACKRAEKFAASDPETLDPAILDRVSALSQRLQEDEQDRQFIAGIDAMRLEAALGMNPHTPGPIDHFRRQGGYSQQVELLFKGRGIEFGNMKPEQFVAWLQSRPEEVKRHFLTAVDIWLAGPAAETTEEQQWLNAVLRAADGNPWRTEARQALLARDSQALEKIIRDVRPSEHPAAFLTLLAGRLRDESNPAWLELLERTQREHPNDFWANHNLGVALIQNDIARWSEAARYCMAAVALRPDIPSPRTNLGIALQKMGDLDSAIAWHHEAIRVKAENANAHLNLGIALKAKGDVEQAIAEYLEAIRLDSNYAQAHNNLGIALRSKGDLDGTITEFREAVRLKPGDYLAHDWLGYVLLARNDVDAAATSFREALRLNPQYAKGHANLGSALRKQGDLDGAIAEFREATRLDPTNVTFRATLDGALQGKGDLDGTVAAYRETIRVNPENDIARTQLANVLRIKGDLNGSIAEYRNVIERGIKVEVPLWLAPVADGDFRSLSPALVSLSDAPDGRRQLALLQTGDTSPTMNYSPTNSATFQFAASQDSGYQVAFGGLKEGAMPYGDRKYRIEKLPSIFAGLTLVQTKMGHKAIVDHEFAIELSVEKPSFEFLAIDERAIDTYKQFGVPVWLQQFVPTGYKIATDDPLMKRANVEYSVFFHKTDKGPVVLGPPCLILNNAMYFAFFAEAN